MSKTVFGALPTPEDIRAARAWLGWTQATLGEHVGLSSIAIANIEKRKFNATAANLEKIQSAFFDSDIEFIPGGGFKKRSDLVRVYDTRAGHIAFFDDVYHTAKTVGGEILVSGVDETKFDDLLSDNIDMHVSRMNKLKNISFKVLINEDDDNEAAEDYIEYRAVPNDYFASVPFYTYGSKVAIILWAVVPKIIVLNDVELQDAYRKQFYHLWESAGAI